MKRIAVIFEGSIDKRLGVFNAAVNRAKHLMAEASDVLEVDVYLLTFTDGRFKRLLLGTRHKAPTPETVVIEGLTIQVIECHLTLADALRHRLKRPPKDFMRACKRLSARFKDYDIITAHDLLPGVAAYTASQQLGTPYFVTWHGASINTDPFRDPMVLQLTSLVMGKAHCNFCVSNAMIANGQRINDKAAFQPLFNAASADFFRHPDAQIKAWKEELGASPDTKVVTFVGRIDEDKKVWLLPPIFEAIQEGYPGKVTFWCIGDGPLREMVENELAQRPQVQCVMWGKLLPQELPRMMNCTDVLVLPSRMEGLPLVAIEAMVCGAGVVASRVGGTPEVVGVDNTFELDDHFVENIASRAVHMLQNKVEQKLPPHISWTATAQKERDIYLRLLQQDSKKNKT